VNIPEFPEPGIASILHLMIVLSLAI